jgi:hypothetical protein
MGPIIKRIVKATLLPLAFFLFSRRLLGIIVFEKEKGILEYLKMNGMSETAYNVSFVIYEGIVTGPLICLVLDLALYYRLFYCQNEEFTNFFLVSLLKLNVGIILFIMGIVAFIIVISKGFAKAGFAT